MTKLHAGPSAEWQCVSMFIRNVQKEIKKDYLVLSILKCESISIDKLYLNYIFDNA